MIPKIIHYCWFGNNTLDERAKRCIDSWKKFFPDYEIVQWNENNFDVEEYIFAKEAYDEKLWAFVSDVARLAIIYKHGGVYFDTDVEVVKSYADIIKDTTKGFIGFEKLNTVNTGLGFGAEQGHDFIRINLEAYENMSLRDHRNDLASIACPIITTRVLKEQGLQITNKPQNVLEMDIYPSDFFCPIDYSTGKLKRTKNTHSIHWYSASWLDAEDTKLAKELRLCVRIFGKRYGEHVFGVMKSIKTEGLSKYIRYQIKKRL